jgi:hypothetical protein
MSGGSELANGSNHVLDTITVETDDPAPRHPTTAAEYRRRTRRRFAIFLDLVILSQVFVQCDR